MNLSKIKIGDVYVLDSSNPHSYSIDVDDSSFWNTTQEYLSENSHIPFVHEKYVDYWNKGIPIVHVVGQVRKRGRSITTLSKKNVTVFLPRNVSFDNARCLMECLNEIENDTKGEEIVLNEKLVYIMDKKNFGYDYERFPPMNSVSVDFTFREVVSLFIRDAFGQLSEDERKMFYKFRNFNLSDMLIDDSFNRYPIHHDGSGVLFINREGERYCSPVKKYSHLEELNYLFSCMLNEDISSNCDNITEMVNKYSSVFMLFREGEVYSYIPEDISKKQYDECLKLNDEMFQCNPYLFISSARVCSDFSITNEELSFKDNILLSFQYNQENSRGRSI